MSSNTNADNPCVHLNVSRHGGFHPPRLEVVQLKQPPRLEVVQFLGVFRVVLCLSLLCLYCVFLYLGLLFDLFVLLFSSTGKV